MSDDTTRDQAATDEDEALDAHLADLEDGCGCVEVWEHTSSDRTGRTAGE